jgi:anti-sigma B factor antagonist
VQLSTRVSQAGAWTVVTVEGELDLATAPRLRQELVRVVAEGHTHLVLDLDLLGFIDSIGLGVIIGCLKRVRTRDGELRIVCDTPRIRRVFEICDLDRVLELHRTLDEALGAAA